MLAVDLDKAGNKHYISVIDYVLSFVNLDVLIKACDEDLGFVSVVLITGSRLWRAGYWRLSSVLRTATSFRYCQDDGLLNERWRG